MLPGAQYEAAHRLAEQVRTAIERCQPAGLHVTASFGVTNAHGAEIELTPDTPPLTARFMRPSAAAATRSAPR